MIVAGCPTLTLVTSDSLSATVIVIVSVLTISANAELLLPELEDEEELEPPRLPAVVAPVPLLPELEPPLEEPAAALLELPPDTWSPGWRLESETIVPLVGA